MGLPRLLEQRHWLRIESAQICEICVPILPWARLLQKGEFVHRFHRFAQISEPGRRRLWRRLGGWLSPLCGQSRWVASNEPGLRISLSTRRLPAFAVQRALRTQSSGGMPFSASSAPSAFPISEALDRVISGVAIFKTRVLPVPGFCGETFLGLPIFVTHTPAHPGTTHNSRTGIRFIKLLFNQCRLIHQE